MKNEKDVKKKVKALLDKHGWFYWMPPANAYGRSGISDFNVIKAGVFLAIETKFGPNKPTAMQTAFLNSINAEGGFGFVVNDNNLNWLGTFLEDFDAQTALVGKEGKMANEAGARMVDAIRALQALI